MSLSALALRLVTVQALTGRTYAGANVFDSRIGVLNVADEGGRAPFLLVFTDDETQDINGRSLYGQNSERELKLVIEAVVSDPEEINNEVVAVAPATDAGREMILDVMRRQVTAALTDPRGSWAALWGRLVIKVKKVEIARGADSQSGHRFAAKQITFTLDTIGEPAPGAEVPETWSDVLAALDASADLADFGAIIRAAIVNPLDVKPWEVAQAELGLTAAGVKAMGITPLVTNEAGDPVTWASATIDAQTEPPAENPPSLSSDAPVTYEPPADA